MMLEALKGELVYDVQVGLEFTSVKLGVSFDN